MDPEHRFPIRFSLNDVWNLLVFEVPTEQNGEVELFSIPDLLANLEPNETFQWIVYGLFVSNFIEEIMITDIGLDGPVTQFLRCEVKPKDKPLKNGDSFKLLFTFTNNDAWQKVLKSKDENGKIIFYGGFTGQGKARES